MEASGEARAIGLARTVLEFGEEGLGEGVVTEMARGIVAMHEELTIALARRDEGRARARSGAQYAFDADLNQEDDDANNWALLERSEFDPTIIYPGAMLWAGRPGAAAEVEVLRTELWLARGDVLVLVTFRQTAIRSREEALGG